MARLLNIKQLIERGAILERGPISDRWHIYLEGEGGETVGDNIVSQLMAEGVLHELPSERPGRKRWASEQRCELEKAKLGDKNARESLLQAQRLKELCDEASVFMGAVLVGVEKPISPEGLEWPRLLGASSALKALVEWRRPRARE